MAAHYWLHSACCPWTMIWEMPSATAISFLQEYPFGAVPAYDAPEQPLLDGSVP